jgi:photosystem II stability/assembly factor-like uncharacterized protein
MSSAPAAARAAASGAPTAAARPDAGAGAPADAPAFTLCVGTAGTSVWFSRDLGETWDRPYSESGLYLESRVWALATHTARPGEVLAGTDSGVYRWQEAERRWTHLPSPFDADCTWALARHPRDPAVIVAGTHPAALWRTDDDGASWRRLEVALAERCIFVGRPRVTQVLFDPTDAETLWAGVEIDAVHRSRDGGATWQRLDQGLLSGDIHGLAVVRNGATTVFATTNKGLHRSDDGGETWRFQALDSPWQYTRTIVARADGDDTLFLTNGNGPPGSTGRLLRSLDHGNTWHDVGLPGTLNSTPWCVASHPAAPTIVFTVTNLGQLFRSLDGGTTWTKLAREFGEVRSLALLPQASMAGA